MSDISALL